MRRPLLSGRARKGLLGLLGAVALAGQLGCAGPPPEVPASEIDRARAALEPFQQELVATLMTALADGPAHAISVCRVRAPEIAEGLAVDGVEMGRTSHRLRNPSNAPRAWVEPLLAWYLEHPDAREGRAVRIDAATFGYVEPIELKPFCLSCHGPSVEPELYASIRELYPEDEAVGFHAGELRGLFWVSMPLAAGS